MRIALLATVVVAVVLKCAFAQAAIEGPVRVDGGLLAGAPAGSADVQAYKAIPYAAPPLGHLRWRAPQPGIPWKGVRKAVAFSKACIQKAHAPGSYYQIEYYRVPQPTSEDCLYLNVWTAAKSASDRRPVIVWIHGGGFAQGSGATPAQNPEALARKGVVAVSFNYRLGVFGLLAHPELSRESGVNASGNYGLMDQIAALRWVKRNIAAFGGDPEQVTVFGQSAGASSIATLMTSPLAKGLFIRAIADSSFSLPQQSLRDAERQGAGLARRLGARSLAELRQVSADELLNATDRLWHPIIDGYVVPRNPYDVFASGAQLHIPVLLGSVSNERGNYPQPHSVAEYVKFTETEYSRQRDAVIQAFPVAADHEAASVYLRRERDWLSAEMRAWALYMRSSGSAAYVFYFDRSPPPRAGETSLGAVHMTEVAYAMGALDTIDRPWTSVDRTLSDLMSSYWTNFAKTGDPNGRGLPEWPKYNGDQIMELGDHVGPAALPDPVQVAWFVKRFALINGVSR